jgi:maltose alpha-D-glucosyltransferase/alpha-amylase
MKEASHPTLLPAEADWYKDAVIYELHVKTFCDSNGDGIGDFPGLTSKLDYIAALGATAIWLLPFYPSPLRDDGYDVADYTGVNPDYGTLDDVRAFLAAARALGLRVITELVLNHTSDQHAWFQRARLAPLGSPERDYYVWSDDNQKYAGTRVIFNDTETANWTWDPAAGAYYWHRFFSHQPDLNFDNPHIAAEFVNVMRFWADLGVDGFRLDAIPYLIEREGTSNENLPQTHAIIRSLRASLNAIAPGCMFLAEANLPAAEALQYFGNGDECQMAFNFPLMPRLYLALARADATPIVESIAATGGIPPSCQWAIFLRNHDELTLEMVTPEDREYLWQAYAPHDRDRINLGIRRRLAPLLGNDRRRIELLNFLLVTLPGTPVIYYGDEIGMGDDTALNDRDGVRTPMQWQSGANAGFSTAAPHRLALPVIKGPEYGPSAVNAEAEAADPGSLLNWTRALLARRQLHQAFGRGGITFLPASSTKAALAFSRETADDSVLCVANLGGSDIALDVAVPAAAGREARDISGPQTIVKLVSGGLQVTLPPFGFRWFHLAKEAAA